MLRISFLIILGFIACNTDKDIPKVENEFKVISFDRFIFEGDEELSSILEKHPAITGIYFNNIINAPPQKSRDEVIKEIRTHPLLSRIDSMIREKYDHEAREEIKEDLTEAFGRIKYYRPQTEIPDVYLIVSEFSYRGFIFEREDGRDAIALGLDMALAPELNYTAIDPSNTAFSEYLSKSYTEKNLVKTAAEVLIEDWMRDRKPSHHMLDEMIEVGKKWYMLDKVLENEHDTLVTNWTEEELYWVWDNEREIYSYLLERDLLYENQKRIYLKYINPSPFSPGMPEEAPGQAAAYIGWQIVESYMDKNPGTTWDELILLDAQKLLNESKYKPSN